MERWLFSCLNIILILSFSSFGFAATTTEKITKKNLCTITINSNDEAELFKSQLSSKLWNFIELAPQGHEASQQDWFSKSCRDDVRCDVLVISGHFGGTFFGSSKLTLSMEDLERNSCDKKCDGILKQPREVFLFGCNTLATKKKDHRSPEEYMQVLLNDGFSAAQASQIVSFRYSGFGDSFKQSMTQIFAATPRIYGFTSVGPSGKKVAPLLKNYLQASRSNYDQFDWYIKKTGTTRNEKLMSSLKSTSISQAAGFILDIKKPEEKPYCYIRSASVARTEKLKYIQNLFKSQRAIQMLGHIYDFIHELKSAEVPVTVEEQTILQEFATDEKLKSELLALLQLQGEIYLPLKANVLNTLKDLELVTSDFVGEAFNKLVDLRTPMTEARKNLLCSSQMVVNIPFSAIPKERWNELEFINALICLRPQDAFIHHRMIEVIETSADAKTRATALWYFYNQKTEDLTILTAIARRVMNDSEVFVRQSAAMVLRQLKPTAPLVHELLQRALEKESDSHVKYHIHQILKSMN